ncbi:MAG: hypothetical protein IPK53_17540 [bacterium]|nr:hypothetical protein [bacterium]
MTKKVMELSREVEDRFGKLPDPARTLFGNMVRHPDSCGALCTGADEVNVMAARYGLGLAADHAARARCWRWRRACVFRYPIGLDATKEQVRLDLSSGPDGT